MCIQYSRDSPVAIIQKHPSKMFYKKGVLKNFAKFIGKQLWQSLLFNNFIKKEALAQAFSCEFCEIFKNTFFTDHLWATASNNFKLEDELGFTSNYISLQGRQVFFVSFLKHLNKYRFEKSGEGCPRFTATQPTASWRTIGLDQSWE